MGYNSDWVFEALRNPPRWWHFFAFLTVGFVGLISKLVVRE
jgi:hypothetical protein